MSGDELRERPLLVLSDRFSSNPLSRFLSGIQLAAFTIVLALPLACALTLLVLMANQLLAPRTSPWMWWQQQWWVALVNLACCWALLHRLVLARIRRSGAVGVFSTDRVVLRRAPVHAADPVTRHVLRYSDVGALGFSPPKKVWLRFGEEGGRGLQTIGVRLLRYTAEDEFDHTVALFEERAPEHVFSIHDDEGLRYSRAWSLDELLPDGGEVRAASIGIGSVLQPDVELRLDDASWHFSLRSGLTRRHGAADWLLQQDVNQVLNRKGMVLCQVTSTLPGRYEIEFGSGEVVTVRTDDREIDLGGETIGALAIRDLGLRIEFRRPVRTVLALVVVVAAMRAEYANRNL